MKTPHLRRHRWNGRQLVEQALQQGHEVTAFVRNPAKMTTQHEKLKIVKGNIMDCHSVGAAVAGQDAVFSALGVRFNWWPLITAIVASQVLVRTMEMPRWLQLVTDIGLPVLALLYTARTPRSSQKLPSASSPPWRR